MDLVTFVSEFRAVQASRRWASSPTRFREKHWTIAGGRAEPEPWIHHYYKDAFLSEGNLQRYALAANEALNRLKRGVKKGGEEHYLEVKRLFRELSKDDPDLAKLFPDHFSPPAEGPSSSSPAPPSGP